MGLGIESRFNIKDGHKTITFMGWELGHASSEDPSKPRWTELTLYRTLEGAYVLGKVGCSDVFHNEDCPRTDRNDKPMSKGKRYPTLEDALPEDARDDDPFDQYFTPCDVCNPDYDESPVWVEKDIHSAPVHDSPQKVINALYQTKGSNRFLSRIARELLEQAVLKDKQLAAALEEPVEIK